MHRCADLVNGAVVDPKKRDECHSSPDSLSALDLGVIEC